MANKDLKVNIIGDASSLKKMFQKTEQDAGKWGDKLKEIGGKVATALAGAFVAGAAAAGAQAGKSFRDAMAAEVSTDRVAASMGLTGEDAEKLGDAAGAAFASGFGESLDEVTNTAGAVAKKLGGLELGDAAFASLVAGAQGVSDTFDTEVNEVIGAAQQLLTNGLAPDAQAALDMVATAMRDTKGPTDEALANLIEYSTHYAQLGLDGKQAIGGLTSEWANSTILIDKVGDAVKELGIRLLDGSELTKEGLKEIGLEASEVEEALAKGGPAAQEMTEQIITSIAKIEDPAKRAQVGVALMGTPFEDLGENAPAILEDLVAGVEEYGGAAQEVADQASENVAGKWTSVWRTVQMAFQEKIGERLLPLAGNLADQISERLPDAIKVFESWMDRASDVLGDLWEAFQEGDGVLDGLKNIGEYVADLIPQDLKNNIGGFTTALTILAGPMGLLVRELLPALSPIFAVVVPYLATMANDLAPQLAEILAVIAETVIPALVDGLEWFGELLKDHPEIIGAVVAGFVALKAVALGQWAMVAVPKILGVMGKLKAVFLANPFGIIAAAVAALVFLIITHWDTIKEYLLKAWEWIKETAGKLWDWIKDIFGKALDFVKNLFLNWTGPGLLIKHFDKIRDTVLAVKNWITEKFQAAVDWLKRLPGKVSSAVAGLFDKAKELATAAKNWITDRFDDVVGFVRKLPDRIGSAASGLWDGIKNTFRAAINWVIDKWNDLKIEMRIPSDIPLIGGKGFTIETPNIPRFHSGIDRVPGRPGQEVLAILEAGERVISAAEAARGGDRHTSISVVAHTNADPRQIAAEIAWAAKTGGI